jgi:threonine/homoserine/homoserine lactone efflux protein
LLRLHGMDAQDIEGEAGRRLIPAGLSGQRPVLHYPLRDQGRCHPLDAGQRGELVVLQLLVRREVSRDDPEQVVGLAEEPLGLHDLGDGRHTGLEAEQRLPVCLPDGDEHQRLEGKAEYLGVHDRAVAADRAAALQLTQPAMTGRDAEAHLSGQFCDREAAVLLKGGKDFAVQRVHEKILPQLADNPAQLGNTFRLIGDSFLGRSLSFEGKLAMAASSVAAFWALAALLVAVPGPDWAFVLSSGVRSPTVVPAVGGIVLGYAGITAVVAAGVGALVARSATALTALTAAGGSYLIWLGARTLVRKQSRDVVGDVRSPGSGAPWETLARGMGVSALNPKGLLLFLALLPQFTNARWDWPLAAQLGLLGLVFMLTCAVFYLCLGSFARRILQARPLAADLITRISGAAMVIIGALLLIDRFIV